MLADRPAIEEALLGLATRRGYTIRRSRTEHAGGKIYLEYRSALGTQDRIEVDLNYLFRTPIEPVTVQSVWQPGELDRPNVRTVGLTELLVGKLLALLARSAPRDLWDVANLTDEARGRLRTHSFRSWFVGIASVLNHPLSTYGVDGIGSRLTQSDLDDQLGPMLTSGKTPLFPAGFEVRYPFWHEVPHHADAGRRPHVGRGMPEHSWLCVPGPVPQ